MPYYGTRVIVLYDRLEQPRMYNVEFADILRREKFSCIGYRQFYVCRKTVAVWVLHA